MLTSTFVVRKQLSEKLKSLKSVLKKVSQKIVIIIECTEYSYENLALAADQANDTPS